MQSFFPNIKQPPSPNIKYPPVIDPPVIDPSVTYYGRFPCDEYDKSIDIITSELELQNRLSLSKSKNYTDEFKFQEQLSFLKSNVNFNDRNIILIRVSTGNSASAPSVISRITKIGSEMRVNLQDEFFVPYNTIGCCVMSYHVHLLSTPKDYTVSRHYRRS